MNKNFYLFCKSYIGDLRRVQRLWSSIKVHNKDQIPFYLCVPEKDLSEFQSLIDFKDNEIIWLTDEQIVNSNPKSSLDIYHSWDGRLSQQVIKSEFWRFFGNLEINYLCIDSESFFIKDFYLKDFLYDNQSAYTVMHQSKELLQLAANKKIYKVIKNFSSVCDKLKTTFNREGVNYDFGPTPVIWSSRVWRDLDEKYLRVNDITIWDAIEGSPSELQWYGEALLAYRSIPLMPLEPIFRIYHYDWQYFFYKKIGETEDSLVQQYLGVLHQSNWDYSYDYGEHKKRKSLFSRFFRRLKRLAAPYR